MFDPSQATKDKALKQLKKRATTEVKLWAEKRIPESVKEGLILDIKELACGDPSCSPIDTVFTFIWDSGKGVFAMPYAVEEIQEEDIDDSFPDEETLTKWKQGIKAPWPPRPALRFGLGDRVECRIGPHPVKGWAPGRVIKLFYSEPDWPPNMVVPYQIGLKDGRLIYAPQDVDQVIRARGDPLPTDPPSPEYPYPQEEEEDGEMGEPVEES